MKLMIRFVLSGGAAALCCLVLGAPPAQALSCVGWPDDVASQAVRGRLPDPVGLTGGIGGRPFTDSYDYALIATVRKVDERGVLHRRGAVDVDVEAAFYRPSVPGRLTLSMTDAGSMLGYPFELGRRYFIPVKAAGGAFNEEGRGPLPNYVMACDPVREVGAGETEMLVAAAGEAGVEVSRPGSATVASTSTSDPRPWSAIGAWSVIALGAVALVASVTARYRRHA